MSATALKFKFTYPEIVYFLECLNGVICQPSTLTANLLGGFDYCASPDIDYTELERKLNALSSDQIYELWSKLNEFWEPYSIPDTEVRCREVGLIC